mgnify:CR=1 FL=1
MASLRTNLDKAIFDALNVVAVHTAAPGGVYNMVAPLGAKPPFVVFQAVSKVDDYSFASRYAQALYQVKAVSRSAWPKEAAEIDDDIDTALQNAALTIAGYTLLYCRREADFYLMEDVGGVIWHNVGGTYRIWADES